MQYMYTYGILYNNCPTGKMTSGIYDDVLGFFFLG